MFNFAIVQRKATDREAEREGRISPLPHCCTFVVGGAKNSHRFLDLPFFRPSEIRCSVKLFELDTASLKAAVRRAPLGERERERRELRLHNQLTSGEVAYGTCGTVLYNQI